MQISTKPNKHLRASNIRYDDGSNQKSANQFFEDVTAHKKLRVNEDVTVQKNELVIGDLTVLGDIYGRFHDMDPTSKLYIDNQIAEVNFHMGWGNPIWTAAYNSISLFTQVDTIRETYTSKTYVDSLFSGYQSGWLYQESGFPMLDGTTYYTQPVTYLKGQSTVLLRNQSFSNRVTFQVQNSTPVTGYVLTCIDGNGTVEWRAPSTTSYETSSIITQLGTTTAPSFSVQDNGLTNTGPLQGVEIIPNIANLAWNNLSRPSDIALLFKTGGITAVKCAEIVIHSPDAIGIKMFSGTSTQRSRLFLHGGSLESFNQFVSLNEYGIEFFTSTLGETTYGVKNYFSRIPYRKSYDAGVTLIPAKVTIGEITPVTITSPTATSTLIYPGELNVNGKFKFLQYDELNSNFLYPTVNQVLTCIDNVGTVAWKNPTTSLETEFNFENEVVFKNKVEFDMEINLFLSCVIMPVLIGGFPSFQFKFPDNKIPLSVYKNGVIITDLWVTNIHNQGTFSVTSAAIDDFLKVQNSFSTYRNQYTMSFPYTKDLFLGYLTRPPDYPNLGLLWGYMTTTFKKAGTISITKPNHFKHYVQIPIYVVIAFNYTNVVTGDGSWFYFQPETVDIVIKKSGVDIQSFTVNFAEKIKAYCKRNGINGPTTPIEPITPGVEVGTAPPDQETLPEMYSTGIRLYLGAVSFVIDLPYNSSSSIYDIYAKTNLQWSYESRIVQMKLAQLTYNEGEAAGGFIVEDNIYKTYWDQFPPKWGGIFSSQSLSTSWTGTTTPPTYKLGLSYHIDQVTTEGWVTNDVIGGGIVTGGMAANTIWSKTHAFLPYGQLYACGVACRDGVPGGSGQREYNVRGNYDAWTNIYNIFWTGTQAQLWIDTTKFVLQISSCDYRIKENIFPSSNILNRLCLIDVISYEFKDIDVFKKDGTHIGVIAHELKELFPEYPHIVEGEKDAVDAEGKIQPQNITQELSFLLLKAIQELKWEVDYLKERVRKLMTQC